jgi:CRP/FNR family transcriptional regulator, anaerobic regulatory protein
MTQTAKEIGVGAMRVHCASCPLRELPSFQSFDDEEIEFMVDFKSGELDVDPGSHIVMEGSSSPHLFTVLSGAGVRSKTLADGRRQVIGFVLPGDFIGLQAAVMEEMQHTVTATTKMLLCVFRRSDFYKMFKQMPERGYDVSWLAAREEHFLGDHLLTVGRRTGLERVAFGLWELHRHALEVGMAKPNSMNMPFSQQDLADALGLSLVHTNKTLKHLRLEQVAEWTSRTLRILDADRLRELAQVDNTPPRKRPLL